MNIEEFSERWTPEPFSGCWLWTRSANNRGYGEVYPKGKGKTLAHRYSWLIYRGEIPANMCVLHRCDTPACVNPAHLFLGSKTDNIRDAVAKGRHQGQKRVFSHLNGWIGKTKDRKAAKRKSCTKNNSTHTTLVCGSVKA